MTVKEYLNIKEYKIFNNVKEKEVNRECLKNATYNFYRMNGIRDFFYIVKNEQETTFYVYEVFEDKDYEKFFECWLNKDIDNIYIKDFELRDFELQIENIENEYGKLIDKFDNLDFKNAVLYNHRKNSFKFTMFAFEFN